MTSAEMEALSRVCKRDGLRRTALRLGYSATTLSLALGGKYVGTTDRIQQRVREQLPEAVAEVQADWLHALRVEAERTSQEQAAQRIGVAESTISQVLSGKYKAATTRIERRVRGELLGAMCECPVMGEVSTRVCQTVQERTPPIANPQHAQAWMACRGRGPFSRAGQCPHFNAGKQPAKDEAA